MSFEREHCIHRLQHWMNVAHCNVVTVRFHRVSSDPRDHAAAQFCDSSLQTGCPVHEQVKPGRCSVLCRCCSKTGKRDHERLHDAPHQCHPIGLLRAAL